VAGGPGQGFFSATLRGRDRLGTTLKQLSDGLGIGLGFELVVLANLCFTESKPGFMRAGNVIGISRLD
jgi:hypothetical protein